MRISGRTRVWLITAALIAVGSVWAFRSHAADSSLSGKLESLLANRDQGADRFNLIHVNDLAALMAKGTVTVYDANHPDTRAQYGVIEGAKLLSSSDTYDVAKELPANKNAHLVFYCANTH